MYAVEVLEMMPKNIERCWYDPHLLYLYLAAQKAGAIFHLEASYNVEF